MRYVKISQNFRAFCRRELGLDDDSYIIQRRFQADGVKPSCWESVADCHASTVPLLQRDGVKAHLELIKVFPHFR